MKETPSHTLKVLGRPDMVIHFVIPAAWDVDSRKIGFKANSLGDPALTNKSWAGWQCTPVTQEMQEV